MCQVFDVAFLFFPQENEENGEPEIDDEDDEEVEDDDEEDEGEGDWKTQVLLSTTSVKYTFAMGGGQKEMLFLCE